MPKVSMVANGNYTDYLGQLALRGNFPFPIAQSAATADVSIRATIPLYQGGRPSAQIKQAQAREGQAMDTEIATERQVIAAVRAPFPITARPTKSSRPARPRWRPPNCRCAG
jgi:outer membrane protein